MNDPYEDQLSAARYKAERDQAQQRLAGLMKSVDNLDNENEHLRDMLNDVAWKLGIGHVVHYYSEDNYQECHKRVLDEISKLTSPTSYDVAQVTTSAYDLLPEEDREALRWVREHGGLDVIEAIWDNDVPLANGVIDALWPGVRPDDCSNEHVMDELSERLMPDGMGWLVETWPRFEDDAPVRMCDEADKNGENFGISTVTLYIGGDFSLNFRSYQKGERVRRPALKVLDADGVEIRVGDTVWGLQSSRAYVVDGFVTDGSHGEYTVDAHYVIGLEQAYLMPSYLTHRAPVLAADGRPLREGETVYSTENGSEFTVIAVDAGSMEVHVRWGYDFEDKTGTIAAKQLTHELPDSWERIEEDAGCTATKYNERRGTIFTTKQQVARDLVRRAKALAERGQ